MLTGDDEAADACLGTLFAQAAATHATQIALLSRTTAITYRELDIAANRLSHALLARGGTTDDRIAILMPHDVPQIVALLAVLKAGRIAVALNPTHPPERLRHMLDHAAPIAVVTDEANADSARKTAGGSIPIMRHDQGLGTTVHDPAIAVPGGHAAALVYTSGSTGRPKAVIATHRQMARNVTIRNESLKHPAADRIPLLNSLSGGQGLSTVLYALLSGATLCPFPLAASGLAGLADWMAEFKITHFGSSASIFRNFMQTVDADHRFHGVRVVRLSSEPATADDFRLFQRHFPADCVFVHTLSSSETCNIAWSRRLHHETVDEGRLPIGLPSRGIEVLLLDEAGVPVQPGEVGEIAVRSRYVAAGYWRDDASTARQFGPDLDGRGTHLVRTGDLGRINRDGMLEFISRSDDRVKIRGNRIALFEVEDAIQRLDGIQRVAVEAVTRDGGEPFLVAFVTQAPDQGWSAASLRSALRRTLSDPMIPTRVVLLDALPFTPTGKIDRDALRRFDLSPTGTPAVETTHTETERFIAGLWREAFARTQVGRDDDFFDLGGDSLIAAVMSARIHATLGLEVELAAYFDHPVLGDFAAAVDRLQQPRTRMAPAREPTPRPSHLPLSYNQESFWNLSQVHGPSLTGCRCSRFLGPLDVAALADCIAAMGERHEMLRTTFVRDHNRNRLQQIVHAVAPLSLRLEDCTGDADPEAGARRIWKAEQTRVFDLGALPLAGFTLIRLRDAEHWLLYSAHGILLDELSWNIFFSELGQLYEQRVQNPDAKPSLTPAPQYADYAVWQRRTLAVGSQRYGEQLAWWTNDILAASYPRHARYRQALSWCMTALPAAPRPLKQAIGASLRGLMGVPPPPRAALPFRRDAAVTGTDPQDGLLDWSLPSDVSRRLDQIGRQEGASRYVTRIAALVAMLAAETGAPDVVLYTTLSNRDRPETQGVFGCCTTTAILMVRCDRQDSFRQLLRRVRDRLRAMQLHADLPYDRIHREMRNWKIKLPQGRAYLTVSRGHAPIVCGNVEIAALPDRYLGAAPLAFDIKLDSVNEAANCVLFDAAHYDPAKVRDFIVRFTALLDRVSHHPDLPPNSA